MFQNKFEWFESVAVLEKWDDHCKLVNLTTQLRGTAYSFYHSCSTEQRSNYQCLVEEMKKRFIHTGIQAQVFHGWLQESVDEYAQELRKLSSKTYAHVTRGGPEAESVWASQFCQISSSLV